VRLESTMSPLEALRALRGDARPFALVGAWAGGGAVLGSEPVRVAPAAGDPFELLGAAGSAASGSEASPGSAAGPSGAGAVGGGWFGYLGYGLGDRVERLPPAPPRPHPLPPFSLAYYDHVLRLYDAGRWWFEALREDHPRLAVLRDRLAAPAPAAMPYELGPFRAYPGRAAHARAVEWCRRYIAAGDLYQANLCLRLDADFEGDPLDLFCAAAGDLAPDRAAYMAGPWGALVSLSPELFLRRRGREVLSAPIKGTGSDRRALEASVKDRAENVMIVDLMRNDLGKSCAYGSVHVPQLARAVRGPGVWHLVSEVAGTVAPEVGDADLVRRAFPPGSVTGAPKIKAMEVISGLESTGREAYTGAIGFASPLAGLELSVAIRTFELSGGRAWLGAGGGITWGSDPDAEYRECLAKARPLVEAAGAELREPTAAAAATTRAPTAVGALPVAPSRAPRPDPRRGVFETLLARDGEPVLRDEHLDRLRASVAELYGEAVPDVELSIPLAGLWRVRLAFVPGAGVRVTCDEATTPAGPLEPRLLVLPGGLGPHKWIDRALMAQRPEPLILDLSGEVLESGSGNVFIREGDTLVTPPADGRILPGVTRAELIRTAGASIEPLRLERLKQADEVFVTSSIRGRQTVRL
jgi:para-aminobenzoate synthetase / 4-amino-4-deoxychorismate lyase